MKTEVKKTLETRIILMERTAIRETSGTIERKIIKKESGNFPIALCICLHISEWSWVINKGTWKLWSRRLSLRILTLRRRFSGPGIQQNGKSYRNTEVQVNTRKIKRFTPPYRAINRCVDVEQETWDQKKMRMKKSLKSDCKGPNRS